MLQKVVLKTGSVQRLLWRNQSIIIEREKIKHQLSHYSRTSRDFYSFWRMLGMKRDEAEDGINRTQK